MYRKHQVVFWVISVIYWAIAIGVAKTQRGEVFLLSIPLYLALFLYIGPLIGINVAIPILGAINNLVRVGAMLVMGFCTVQFFMAYSSRRFGVYIPLVLGGLVVFFVTQLSAEMLASVANLRERLGRLEQQCGLSGEPTPEASEGSSLETPEEPLPGAHQ